MGDGLPPEKRASCRYHDREVYENFPVLCPALISVRAYVFPDSGNVVFQASEGVFRRRIGITSACVVIEAALPANLRRRFLGPFVSLDVQHPERLWMVLALRMDEATEVALGDVVIPATPSARGWLRLQMSDLVQIWKPL